MRIGGTGRRNEIGWELEETNDLQQQQDSSLDPIMATRNLRFGRFPFRGNSEPSSPT